MVWYLLWCSWLLDHLNVNLTDRSNLLIWHSFCTVIVDWVVCTRGSWNGIVICVIVRLCSRSGRVTRNRGLFHLLLENRCFCCNRRLLAMHILSPCILVSILECGGLSSDRRCHCQWLLLICEVLADRELSWLLDLMILEIVRCLLLHDHSCERWLCHWYFIFVFWALLIGRV